MARVPALALGAARFPAFARGAARLRALARGAAAGLALLAACAPARAEFADGWQEAEIVRLSDGARLDFAALAEAARAHDLVIVGEIHDNPRHQRLQAALARALDVRALALEMVPAEAGPALARLRADGDPALREAARWDEYAPWHVVLDAAPEAEVAGAGLPREALIRAIEGGAASAFDGDAGLWGLTRPLPPEQQAALEAELFASHCGALPEAMLPGMAEAQRLRDASFAAALLRARARAGGGPALLVTGDGHARRDRGVPAYLALAAPELSVLSIAQVERAPGQGLSEALAPWGEGVFDIAVLTAPAEREDPCAALRD